MENKLIAKQQILTLTNRNDLTLSGTTKIISIKQDLIQLDTVMGGVMISGSKLELIKLDDSTNEAKISGEINSIKYVETQHKENFFRKIFK